MTTHHFQPLRLLVATSTLALACAAATAQSSAASHCPDFSTSPTNVAVNPGFELPAADTRAGEAVCWQIGDPPPASSAAAGRHMLAFRAGASEGGIDQDVRAIVEPARAYMFSAWVFVRNGKVGPSGTHVVGGPASFTTKVGEWEQLRVCTNSRAVTDILPIYNQDPAGGTFFVDRIELREIPIIE